jgi:hypothetical protein
VFRERVRALAEARWREQAHVVFLTEVKPAFEVPGRRGDGTVEGTGRVRRFFWNLVRLPVVSVVNAVLSVAGGGAANLFARQGKVTGPAGAQALSLVDAARPARSPWLVYSDSHVAVIDTGSPLAAPEAAPEPVVLWHAERPHAPTIAPRNHRLTWPDGSTYQYDVSAREAEYLRTHGA